MLFVNASDIPTPLEPPRPRAGELLSAYRALLTAAEATALLDLDERSVGSSVTVGGERRPRDALLGGDALLDDGTAVVPLVLAARASRALRTSLATRLVLVTGIVRDVDGTLGIEPDVIADLRVIARDWGGGP